jgi:hypothetical protein
MHPFKKMILSLSFVQTYDAAWIPSEPYCITEDIVINQFDFLTVRFIWNFPAAGRDLDIQVRYENNNVPTVDGIDVGYGGATTVPLISNPQSSAYLWWGLDDTNTSGNPTGIEGVLINIKRFKDDFPSSTEVIKVGLYAVWYNSVASGDFSLEVKTYKGGTMSNTGTDIINTGGVIVSSDLRNLNTRIVDRTHNPDVSFKVGTLFYNRTTDTATLTLA